MAQSQYSLSWEDHPKNICNGLSYLQQNGEFVDMTIAADGHLVKVHQVIMALSSSFLKELIASAQCPHPVIVLNKISHTTLSAILEYVYTGEVLVAIEDIRDLIDAAKELHIKGLQEMNLSVTKPMNQLKDNELILSTDNCVNIDDEDISYYEIHKSEDINSHDLDNIAMNETGNVSLLRRTSDCEAMYAMRTDDAIVGSSSLPNEDNRPTFVNETNPEKILQYTVSTHGSLQLILNRFVYYLKNTRADQTRQWRCVDYLSKNRCPAVVMTKNNMVLQRMKAHKHPFHDKKILKKLKVNNVFSELVQAAQSGACLKRHGLGDSMYIDSE